MRQLHAISTLDPAFGGPVMAVTDLSRALLALGVHVEIVTLDDPRRRWPDQISDHVQALGPGLGRYRYSSSLVPWISANARKYDVLVVHGVWQYQSFATWLATRRRPVPYVLMVHGALDPWFRHRYPLKHLKKSAYWRLIESRVVRDAAAVLYGCEEERLLASRTFQPYRARDVVVKQGIGDPGGDPMRQKDAFLDAFPALRGRRLLLFVGRIHPVKGCDLLVEAFSKVVGRDEGLRLVMVGPDQIGWQRELASRTRALGVADRVVWTGMLSGDLKWGAYRAAEALVLPSHSESFGIVVTEALACGVPVLIANKVKIWREIAAAGAGLVEDDTLAGTAAVLRRWLNLDHGEREQVRLLARECFLTHFEIGESAKAFMECIGRTVAEDATVPNDSSPARSRSC